MREAFIDLETYSETPIKYGAYKYAEKAEVLLFAYALDDGPVSVWDVTADPQIPDDLFEIMVDDETLLIAHNVGFDRTVLRATELCGSLVSLRIERWRCVMAQALAHSLPGKLELLGQVLGLSEDEQKMKDSKSLINLFTKPRPKNMKLRRATRETHPEEWARFVEYARQDVASMRTIYRKLPTWNYTGRELALWHLDQACNDAGFAVDLDLAHAAIRASERAQAALAVRTQELTDYNPETGEGVEAATQRDKLLDYILVSYGVTLPDMKADTLERRLDDPELPEAVKELLRVRLSASKTSASKYKRLVQCTSSDGRLRGTMQFCGAGRTGRSAGRIFNPLNLMRPDMEHEDIEAGIEAMKADAEDLLFDDVMRLCGNAVRGSIIAPPGKKLCISDLSNIEGRMLAWLAGEEWKLQAFRDFDEGRGADLYKLAYARAFDIPVEDVTKDNRQIGKCLELACGYGGGVGAFLTMAATYSMDLDKLTTAALPTIPQDVLREAEDFWRWAEQKKMTFGLPRDTFLVCDSLKRLWRYAHPETVKLWNDLEAAVKRVARTGGTAEVRMLRIDKQKSWLRIRLPSGRSLCYPAVRLLEEKGREQISYMGINMYSRKWQRIRTYSGRLVENVDQAASRDVLMHNKQDEISPAGYDVVLDVYDEVVAEVPDSPEFSADDLSARLAKNPPWCPELPLAAAGFETYRYRKE